MKELEKLRLLLNRKIEEGNTLESLLPLSEKLDKMVIKFMGTEETEYKVSEGIEEGIEEEIEEEIEEGNIA